MPQQRKRSGWRVFWGIIVTLSVLANIGMFLIVIGLIVAFGTHRVDGFMREVLETGPGSSKIAVINLKGIIDDRQAYNLAEQIEHARKDSNVKGIVLRVASPGGTVSASDQIHREITKFRTETKKPVVAFMQGVAASGGYYTSVACDKIVAEPTTITGSIGVIMGYLVLEDLLKGKLGIEPVTLKSGQKKDWPSSFSKPNDEQLQYLQEKIITPVYDRFVQIVDEGRPDLSLADVRRLADGSIYPAQEALDEKLIDKIAYLDGAIDEVKALAGITDARVIEYKKQPSLLDMLTAESRSKSLFNFDRTTLYELTTPDVMYLWRVNQ
jgi:protease-4